MPDGPLNGVSRRNIGQPTDVRLGAAPHSGRVPPAESLRTVKQGFANVRIEYLKRRPPDSSDELR